MLGEERAFLLLLKQESNPSDSSMREDMIAYIDELIRRIDQKIRILENQIIWKDAYDIAVILPFRSDVMPSALGQWKLEITKVTPNAAKLTMPKSLFQNYDLYDGIMSYLSYRLDTSIQLNLSIWDNLNSIDSNQAILNLLEQNPPDFIIGPGFGGKSNSMLRSTLVLCQENGASVFDPGCTKLDTSMLNGNYIGYQPSYLETFYSSLEVAARKDSSAYIIVFQPDTNPQYNKLIADMEAAVYAFNERFNTRFTPVTYGLLKGESLSSLKSKCLVSGRKSFIHLSYKKRSTYRSVLRAFLTDNQKHFKRYGSRIGRVVGYETIGVSQGAQNQPYHPKLQTKGDDMPTPRKHLSNSAGDQSQSK